jgi:mannose-6-phosphate isomerase-like protein (cupin superfamily)
MYTLSENCPRRARQVAGGKGTVQMKDLATKEQMYNHARLFTHITVDPGCSIGPHTHEHETEFYYILKGEAVFSDNGKEMLLHAGDVSATGYGEGHSLENRTGEPVELIALIVLE